MRTVARIGLAALLATSGCGRIGYDQQPDATEIDADPIQWQDTSCFTPVQIYDHGSAVGGPYVIDVAATDTGFVIIWSIGSGHVKSTAVAVDTANRIGLIQSASVVVESYSTVFSTAALGNKALVGVDNATSNRIDLYPVDELGYGREPMKAIDSARAFGHAFVVADPGRSVFVVAAAEGGAVTVHVRDPDAHPWSGPDPAFAESVTEGAGAAPMAGGYVLFTGNATRCLLTPVDTSLMPIAAEQEQTMTCHNASALVPPGSGNVIAAWNCDNDAVWTVAGDPTTPLPGYRAIYGDSTNSSFNPRLAPAPAGAWYSYQVVGGRIGAVLLDRAGQDVAGSGPADIYQSADVVAYDLVSRLDQTYLFWLEAGGDDVIWAMRLCPP